MKKLNVIDLDKTLIPFDSYRLLVIREMKKMDLSLMAIVSRRLLRTISLKEFKRQSIIHLQKKYEQPYFDAFALEMIDAIDSKLMHLIDKHSDADTLNVLISASPDFYVKKICQKLNWSGSGSFIGVEGKFTHLYGLSKLDYVNEHFPEDSFDYNFSVSDSDTDDMLLSKFKISEKWISQ